MPIPTRLTPGDILAFVAEQRAAHMPTVDHNGRPITPPPAAPDVTEARSEAPVRRAPRGSRAAGSSAAGDPWISEDGVPVAPPRAPDQPGQRPEVARLNRLLAEHNAQQQEAARQAHADQINTRAAVQTWHATNARR